MITNIFEETRETMSQFECKKRLSKQFLEDRLTMIKWRSDTFVSPCVKHILLTVRNATQQFAKIPIVCISFVQ